MLLLKKKISFDNPLLPRNTQVGKEIIGSLNRRSYYRTIYSRILLSALSRSQILILLMRKMRSRERNLWNHELNWALEAKSRTRLSDFTFTFTFHFHALEKEMATHRSVLAWRIPGTEEPGGLPSLESQSRTRLKWLSSSSSSSWKLILAKSYSSSEGQESWVICFSIKSIFCVLINCIWNPSAFAVWSSEDLRL